MSNKERRQYVVVDGDLVQHHSPDAVQTSGIVKHSSINDISSSDDNSGATSTQILDALSLGELFRSKLGWHEKHNQKSPPDDSYPPDPTCYYLSTILNCTFSRMLEIGLICLRGFYLGFETV